MTSDTPSARLAPMAEHASHPVFARVYARVAEMSERRGGVAHRRKLLAGAARPSGGGRRW
jgi:hypothetical protein